MSAADALLLATVLPIFVATALRMGAPLFERAGVNADERLGLERLFRLLVLNGAVLAAAAVALYAFD